MSVFYDRFERHGHAEGLKAQSTHYCPGCGHGLAHKYMADAIAELGIQDRTVAVSRSAAASSCTTTSTSATRRPPTAGPPRSPSGTRSRTPESIVISYQARRRPRLDRPRRDREHRQLGIPISVIFVNNAIYGMTAARWPPRR